MSNGVWLAWDDLKRVHQTLASGTLRILEGSISRSESLVKYWSNGIYILEYAHFSRQDLGVELSCLHWSLSPLAVWHSKAVGDQSGIREEFASDFIPAGIGLNHAGELRGDLIVIFTPQEAAKAVWDGRGIRY